MLDVSFLNYEKVSADFEKFQPTERRKSQFFRIKLVILILHQVLPTLNKR